MNINNVHATTHTTTKLDSSIQQSRTDKSVKQEATIAQDQVEIGIKPVKVLSYERPPRNSTEINPDAEAIKELEERANQKFASLKELVKNMLEMQGKNESTSINIHIEIKISGTDNTVAEENYWGAKETAARIVNFAKAITGDDPTKINLMRDAFKEGFAEAEKAFGGSLPQISKDTYDEVMRLFDEWETN